MNFGQSSALICSPLTNKSKIYYPVCPVDFMKNKGFTLIEVLVSVAIFSMLISVFAGFLVGSIRSQQRALASQQLVDSVSYNLEYISRALRMARKDIAGGCVGAGFNYETNVGRDRIRFLNYEGRCQEFFLEGNRLRERRSTDGRTVNFGTALSLTPAVLPVISFRLGPSDSWGQTQTPLTQPRVTLSLRIERSGGPGEPPLSMNIQATISQRNLNRIR